MAVPGIPVNFILQQANGQVLLTWDLMAGATTYGVARSTDGVSYSTVSTPATNLYLDTAVTVGTNYFYKVLSTNVSGSSSYCSAQSITPVYQGQMTLGQLRLLSQQTADMVGSQFVGTAEWNVYINQSAFELYDLLTTVYENYNVAPVALFQSTGAQQYDLPNGANTFLDSDGATFTPKPFYKLIGVDCGLALGNNAWITLRRFNFISRNRFVFPNLTSTYLGVYNLRYELLGNKIMFIPTPSGGQFLRIWYIPKMLEMLQDTDILDGISGWTEYITTDAAIKAKMKQEDDVSALVQKKMMLKARIEESATNRDAGEPQTISDTRTFGQVYGSFGPQGDGSYGGY